MSGPWISPLDANYRRVPGPDEFGSQRVLSTIVHAGGCTPLLLYVLPYGLDTHASRQLGQTPVIHVRLTSIGEHQSHEH